MRCSYAGQGEGRLLIITVGKKETVLRERDQKQEKIERKGRMKEKGENSQKGKHMEGIDRKDGDTVRGERQGGVIKKEEGVLER